MSEVFPFMGGKSGTIATHIIFRLPPHHCYCEPFCGSIAVLYALPKPSPVEVINDLNSDIVNFFEVMREAGKSQDTLKRFQDFYHWVPFARETFESWWKQYRNKGTYPDDPIEKAAIWYYLQCNAIDGHGGWSHASSKNKANEWQTHIARIPAIADRLKSVQIEHEDFAYVIECYDKLDTVFYIDSPYLGVEGAPSYYKGAPPFTIERHIELARLLNSIRGKAIVSYYPHPLLEQLYPKDKWTWETIDVAKSSQGTEEGIVKDRGQELLLYNYEPLPLFKGLTQ